MDISYFRVASLLRMSKTQIILAIIQIIGNTDETINFDVMVFIINLKPTK